jgi:dissimilatory sulfite reductase (desulfoviridin) alpha/beta subunit
LPTFVAVDDEIFDVVAPKLVSFNDEQLAEVFRLARTMTKTGRLRYLSEIAARLSREPSDHEIRRAIEGAAAGC